MRITIWGVRLMTLYLLNAIDKRSRISRGNAEEQPIMNVHTSSETVSFKLTLTLVIIAMQISMESLTVV